MGGALYIEGTDFGYNHHTTGLFVHYLGATYIDRAGNNNTGVTYEINGQPGTFTSGLRYPYMGGQPYHILVDQISADEGTLIFDDEDHLGRAVSNAAENYRTIVSSAIFYAIEEGVGSSTRNYLMNQYLSFLDPGWNNSPSVPLADNYR